MRRLIIILILSTGFSSCTDVSFRQINFGPKGVDFTKGTCLVNDLHASTTKENNIKLTSITMKYFHEMCGDSAIQIETLRSTGISGKIPVEFDSGLIDSLRIHTSHYYLVHITFESYGKPTGDITVKPSNFVDELDSEMYLDNRSSVNISVFEIRTGKKIYEQVTKATESVDTESASLDDTHSQGTMFTRSSLNVTKNALVRGLKDLRKHSMVKK